jgi:PAS domain S-box-containing protein
MASSLWTRLVGGRWRTVHLLEALAAGVCVLDAEGRIADANRHTGLVLGYAPAEMRGRPLAAFMDDRTAVHARPYLDRCAQGVEEDRDFVFQKKDGSPVALTVAARPLRSGRGDPAGLVCLLTNVREAEGPAAVSTPEIDRYRQLAELAQDQIFVIGRDDRVEYVNRSAAEQFHTTPDRLIGRRRDEIFPPAVAEQQRRSLDRVFETRTPFYVESRAVYRGRDVWLGTWLTPVAGASGSVTAVLGSSRDITERKQAEEALRHSEHRLQAVLSYLPLVLWTTDRDQTVTFCAGCGLESLGRTPEEVVGRPIAQLAPEGSGELGGHLSRALAGETTSGQVALGSRTLEIWCAPRRDADEAVVGVLGLLVDVTERRRLEEHLSRTETLETIGRLAGGIAHDFNNHLTAILGYVEMILSQIGDDKPISADLREVERAANRGAGLVRRLLAFGRRQVVQPRPLSLNEVITGLRPMLGRLIGERIQVVYDLDPRVSWIHGDTGQLEQALMNLALNARDAMLPGGTLRIATEDLVFTRPDVRRPTVPPGHYAALVVSDTGAGMDAETREHLFEPFFTTKPVGQGTGLGLPTVYGIVKQFGGFIFVESEVGRGSTFTLYWPAVEAPADVASQVRPPASAPVVGRETILLVEDEDTVRRFARRALERHGFHVIESASPQEALVHSAADGPVHLLVTDVVMPGASGPELAAQFRRLRPGVPVLYISGYPGKLVAEGGVLGEISSALLMKPFTSAELLERVAAALRRPAGGA